MTHKVKPHWIPAFQEYHLICTDCGRNVTLEDNVQLGNLIIDVDGDCESVEVLGINVKENVGIKDVFGGA